MSLAGLSLADIIGGFLGLFFTILVFSYLLGDNLLFRLAIHIFIGVSAGITGVVAVYSVILPHLIVPLFSGNRDEMFLSLVPILLSALLLTKVSARLSRWGNISMAYLVGVGAAAAIGGAVIGTLVPQVGATINLFDLQFGQESGSSLLMQLFNGSIILVGALTTLVYFHFGIRSRSVQAPRRQVWIGWLGQVGQIFIAIAFGVIFAGVYSAALMALIERLHFMVNFVKILLLPFIST